MNTLPPAAVRPSSRNDCRLTVAGCVLLAVLLLAAYANSFGVPFLLDDDDSIRDNATLRSFATAFFPPADSGVTVSGRPLLNVTLAINHALGGGGVAGYHAVNLLIHFAAALCLCGVVRRTLLQPRLADRFGAQAGLLAWLCALLWALHPLQTGAVTYVIQRAEALVGLCYLFTLYAFIRATNDRSRLWSALTVLGAFLGMAAKEVMVSAPLVLLLYDRTFVSGSFREGWRLHRSLHLGVLSSWALLLALLVSSGARGSTVGFGAVGWFDYAATQGPGLSAYLGKAIVPVHLVFDHGPVVEKRALPVVAGLLLVALLAVATVVLLRRRPAAGFLGAWFFLILAPTSSVVPVASQTLAEHRMYLPLAAIVVTAVILLFRRAGPRLGPVLLTGLAVVFGILTFQRNAVYATKLSLWEDTVRKVPDNPRAQNNLGAFYLEAGRTDDALRHLGEALQLVPEDPHANANIGRALLRRGLGTDGSGPRDAATIERGIAHLAKAVALAPDNAWALGMYGNGLLDAGRADESVAPLSAAIALKPESADFQFNLANALFQTGRDAEAGARYREALRLDPENVEALANYGQLLRRNGRLEDALAVLARAADLAPASVRVRSNHGVTLLAAGRTAEGMAQLNEALRLDPAWPQALYHLSLALAESGQTDEAIRRMETLLKIAPPTAELLSNLGVLYARAGRTPDAIACLRRALEIDPAHEAARENLRVLTAGRG